MTDHDLPPLTEKADIIVKKRFSADESSVAEARAWVRETAERTGHGRLAPTLELLVSELATNALRHAQGDGFLVEYDADSHVVIAVYDDSDEAPKPREPGPDETGGRGLQIVESLSDRWAVELWRGGKRIWFQVDDSAPSVDPGARAAPAPKTPAPGEVVARTS